MLVGAAFLFLQIEGRVSALYIRKTKGLLLRGVITTVHCKNYTDCVDSVLSVSRGGIYTNHCCFSYTNANSPFQGNREE